MFVTPSIVNETEFELILDEDLPLIEGELVTDAEGERYNQEADEYECRISQLDREFVPSLPIAPAQNTPRSESFRVWMAEGEVLKAQAELERALKNLAEARVSFSLATTPPKIQPVI
jgi:hypothetical protein